MGLICTLNCLSQEESRKCCIDYKSFLTVSWALEFASIFLQFLTSLFRILIYKCRRELSNVTRSENDTDKHSVVSFSKERNPNLRAGSVWLLFSRLTSLEQAGLKCSVWFEATAKIENLDFTSLTAHHRTALTWANTCQGSACNSQSLLPKNMTDLFGLQPFWNIHCKCKSML